MPPPKPDPLERTSGFGPNRHRMEIELMEKRFRERSERRSGSPPSTGEIEGRVSDEMRQFFDASTQQLEAVVPRLQEGQNGGGMVETTGEIKKRIDEFFSEGRPAAPVATAASPVAAAPPRPARVAARPAPSQTPVPVPAPAIGARPAAPAQRTLSPKPASATPAARPPSVVAAAAEEPAPMDLKTALEKLRRHGVAKGNDAIARPAAARSAAPPMRAVVPATAARVSSPPQQAVRSPSPTVAEPRVEAPPPRGSAVAPAPQRPVSPPRPAPLARPVTNARNGSPGASRVTVPPGTPVLPPRPKPKAPGEKTRQISELPAISTDEVGVLPGVEATIRGERPAPKPLAPAAPGARATPAVPATAAAQPAPAASATAPAPPAPESVSDQQFDAIFDEVSGIVMDTLKASVNETFDAARAAEPELARVAVPTLGAPVSDPPSPAAAAPPPVRPTSLPRPEEDDAEEGDEAPAAPHDWGVKRAASPKGAWLLDAPERPAAPEPSPKTVTGELPALAKPAASSSGGARAYLLRKAGDEVRRFQPVLKALQQKKIVDAERPAAAAGRSDDEFVSADSFKDGRPTSAEMEEELSPMRLVEELRRLKRVTQALLAKGVIAAEDLAKAAEE